jgi:Zn-dependent protease
LNETISKIFLYIVIVLSAVIHEYSHGFMANELGDETAKRAGRLTLNPLAHIDPIGTVLVPLVLMLTSGTFIGWAKPVPFDPRNIRDPKGELKIALAGPISNLCLAVIISLGVLGLRFAFPELLKNEALVSALGLIIYVNIFLALFNFIPIPPLDGSKILGPFLPLKARQALFSIGPIGLIIGLFIGMMIVPSIAKFIFALLTGFGFVFG